MINESGIFLDFGGDAGRWQRRGEQGGDRGEAFDRVADEQDRLQNEQEHFGEVSWVGRVCGYVVSPGRRDGP